MTATQDQELKLDKGQKKKMGSKKSRLNLEFSEKTKDRMEAKLPRGSFFEPMRRTEPKRL
jgi:hypothetical protein